MSEQPTEFDGAVCRKVAAELDRIVAEWARRANQPTILERLREARAKRLKTAHQDR